MALIFRSVIGCLFSFFLLSTQAQNYRFEKTIGLPLKNGEFNFPTDVAIDGLGNIYVADTWNARIQVFNSNGEFLFKFGEFGINDGQFFTADCIAIGQNGNIVVGDDANSSINIFNQSGEFIRKFGSGENGDEEFDLLNDIAVSSNGNIYVADNHRIQIFSPSGEFISAFGSQGSGNGQFAYDVELAIDAAENIFVADENNHRVQVFNSSGSFIRKFGSVGSANGQFQYLGGIAIDSNNDVYITDSGNSRIQKFSPTGNFIKKFSSFGAGQISVDQNKNIITPTQSNQVKIINDQGQLINTFGFHELIDGKFSTPIGITTDKNGNLYVADSDNQRIQVFNSSGAFINKFGTYGVGNGEFLIPRAIAVDDSKFYVLDNSLAKVQIFDRDWNFISKFGRWGYTDGQFNSPTGIAVHPNGNIYVLEGDANQVQVFNNSGAFIKKFGSYGTGEGQFDTPLNIWITEDGTVYIADTENYRIQIFTENGSFIRQITNANGEALHPTSVTVDNDGFIYVINSLSKEVIILNNDGSFFSKFGNAEDGGTQMAFPLGVSVSSDKTVYVSDTYNNWVQVFKPTTETETSISFNDLQSTYGDASFNLNATSNSTGAISYSIVSNPSNTGEITLSGENNKLVTITKAGKVKIKASVAADANHAAASKEIMLTINKAPQTISFDALPDVILSSQSFSLVASSDSGLPVAFSITAGATFVSMNGLIVTLKSIGTVSIQATQPGNENYLAAAPVIHGFQITDHEIPSSSTFADLQVNYGEAPFELNATSENTGTISYSIVSDPSNTGEITLSNKTVTIKKAGKIKLRASVASDGNHPASSKEATLTIKKAELTATANNATKAYGEENPPLSLSISGFKYTDSANELTSAPALSTSATASSNWGSYSIDVTGGVDESYEFKYVNGTLFVTKALQTLSFDEIPDQFTTSAAFDLTASSSVGLSVSFKIIKGDDLVTLDQSTVTLKGLPGKVTIEAIQPGNQSYHAASVTRSFQIIKNVISGLEETVMDEIYVGPNPASDIITIQVPSIIQVSRITLTDSQGRLVINKPVVSEEDLSLSVSSLAKGMHIIGVYTSDKSIFRKIVVN